MRRTSGDLREAKRLQLPAHRRLADGDAETAMAFLDQVNAIRTKSLAGSRLDQNYVGPDAEDKPNSLRSIVKRRRLFYAIPVVISLLLLVDALFKILDFL
jgi:hypothetical protein